MPIDTGAFIADVNMLVRVVNQGISAREQIVQYAVQKASVESGKEISYHPKFGLIFMENGAPVQYLPSWFEKLNNAIQFKYTSL